MSGTSAARARALARRTWPVRRFVLGQEPGRDLSGSTTPQERLEMMWPLALDAWSMARQPIPDYARSEAPVRRLRWNNG